MHVHVEHKYKLIIIAVFSLCYIVVCNIERLELFAAVYHTAITYITHPGCLALVRFSQASGRQ